MTSACRTEAASLAAQRHQTRAQAMLVTSQMSRLPAAEVLFLLQNIVKLRHFSSYSGTRQHLQGQSTVAVASAEPHALGSVPCLPCAAGL